MSKLLIIKVVKIEMFVLSYKMFKTDDVELFKSLIKKNYEFAIKQNCPEIVKYCVIDLGMDVNLIMENSYTPLTYSCIYNCEMIDLLLSLGADINKPDGKKLIPIEIVPQMLYKFKTVECSKCRILSCVNKEISLDVDVECSLCFNLTNKLILMECNHATCCLHCFVQS
jgi:hypothetical protein